MNRGCAREHRRDGAKDLAEDRGVEAVEEVPIPPVVGRGGRREEDDGVPDLSSGSGVRRPLVLGAANQPWCFWRIDAMLTSFGWGVETPQLARVRT